VALTPARPPYICWKNNKLGSTWNGFIWQHFLEGLKEFVNNPRKDNWRRAAPGASSICNGLLPAPFPLGVRLIHRPIKDLFH
jgi:hypothetical protein